MAKRFTDTEKWNDPWFHSLTKDEKTLWLYLLDRCDHAGLWEANPALLRFHLGQNRVDLKKFEGRLVILPAGRWFIPGFITFQYGVLNVENRAHLSVVNRLKKLNLWPIPLDLLSVPKQTPPHPQTSPFQGATVGASVGAKDKDKDNISRARATPTSNPDFDRFWLLYPKHVKKQDAIKAWTKLNPSEKLQVIMFDAIDKQKQSEQWTKEGVRFVPNPATWLNEQRWEDELPMATKEEYDWRIAKPTAKH